MSIRQARVYRDSELNGPRNYGRIFAIQASRRSMQFLSSRNTQSQSDEPRPRVETTHTVGYDIIAFDGS